MLRNWTDSEGSIKEHEVAKEHGIKIFYEVDGYPKPEDL